MQKVAYTAKTAPTHENRGKQGMHFALHKCQFGTQSYFDSANIVAPPMRTTPPIQYASCSRPSFNSLNKNMPQRPAMKRPACMTAAIIWGVKTCQMIDNKVAILSFETRLHSARSGVAIVLALGILLTSGKTRNLIFSIQGCSVYFSFYLIKEQGSRLSGDPYSFYIRILTFTIQTLVQRSTLRVWPTSSR